MTKKWTQKGARYNKNCHSARKTKRRNLTRTKRGKSVWGRAQE